MDTIRTENAAKENARHERQGHNKEYRERRIG